MLGAWNFRWMSLQHKGWIALYCLQFAASLLWRSVVHDWSKFTTLEARGFGVLAPRLKASTYGSPEYKEMLAELQPVLDHHYKHNRHHPEHHQGGIDGMRLLDVVEMYIDWRASIRKHKDGNIHASIDHNEVRFEMAPQLAAIYRNTAGADTRDPQ